MIRTDAAGNPGAEVQVLSRNITTAKVGGRGAEASRLAAIDEDRPTQGKTTDDPIVRGRGVGSGKMHERKIKVPRDIIETTGLERLRASPVRVHP
jgi:hypothetical protein